MRTGFACLTICLTLIAGHAVAQIEAPTQTLPPAPTQRGEPTQPPNGPSTGSTRPAHAPPAIDLSRLETNDLQLLYFDPAETYLTPHIARSFENSFAFQKRTFGWKPWDKTTVLLKDFGDYGNAAARASPNNALLIDIGPLSQTFETFSAGDRFYALMNHELVHVATMDVWNKNDALWRRIFHGKPMPLEDHPESILYNYLATPRVNVPRWYLEGSAVFMETWMAGGFGRAQGGYDEMVFRAMVRDNARFFSPLGLESEGTSIDFQVGVNEYLYGTRFFSYLALTYSPEKVIAWLRRDEGSAGYYSVQFKRVFGKSLDSVWADWIVWEHGFQHDNLKSVASSPLTPGHRLAPQALGSVSRAFYDPKTDSLIGAFRPTGIIAHVGVLSLRTGIDRKLADIKGAMLYRVTSLAYDPDDNRAWYTTNNYAYRNLMEINPVTGKTRELIKGGRIGDIVYDRQDKSLWGLRHLNGLVTLVHIPPPYTSWSQVHTFPYGEIPFDLDVSPDGQLLSASVGEINGDQWLRVFRTAELSNDEEPTPVAQFRQGSAMPEGFVFSPDGRYLYGSSYYTGVSNIYRFEIATNKIEALTNASTGFFRPIPRADGSLIVFEYTGQGFVPELIDPKPLDDLGAIKFLGAQVAEQHPIVKTWAVGSPAGVPLDSMITRRDHYVPLDEIKLAAIYPVVEGYKTHPAVGVHAIFEDPMQFNQFLATLSYTPGSTLPSGERLHADLEFHDLHWSYRYWHNDANFYDLFGPIDRSRKGDAFIVGYKNSFIYDPPRQLDFTSSAAFYTGLDTLPGAQNILASEDGTITEVNAALRYSNTDRSLGSVDYERGMRWNVVVTDDYSHGENFPQAHAGFDYGVGLPWPHSSVWLYNAVGIAGGDSTDPLSQFYLGSFENNYVDDGEVKHYREWDSFPGFGIDAISARRFFKSLLELNLPPVRFSEVGVPSLFLSSARPALFAGLLAVDPVAGGAHVLGTAGGQLDWNFTVALRLPMTFSVGYAEGFGQDRRRSGEFLLSLKIL
ncbi:MAG TPA: hypothetical protein VII73_09415 [Caulobacteraceae bacterium]